MDRRFNRSIETDSSNQTEKMAAKIGAKLKGGEVMELISDLGGGKTTFVKGLVSGSGSEAYVSSPSFTLRNDYAGPKLSIAHFDFYRLKDPGILSQMLAEAMSDPATVVIIEWGGIVDAILPPDHVKVTIKVSGETKRLFEMDCPMRFKYLFEGIK